MRSAVFVIGVTACLSGCANIDALINDVDSVVTAAPFVGLQERQNRYELKALTGVDPVRIEWCAAFINAILEIDGIPGSDSVSNTPLLARSFLDWGDPVEKENIQRGDLVVFPRGTEGWQGHVGFYVETVVEDDVEYWIILGGNQDQSVSYAQFNPNHSIGIRRYPINTTVQSAQ